MNIDEMTKKENDASRSGMSKSEGKNSNDPENTSQVDDKQNLNRDAGKGADTEHKEKAAVENAQPVKEMLKPGAQLAAIRVAAGIEQEQVAASLKMTVRQVRELEADNYESLHGVAISRGFVRAYAKMLQVDPEPFVAMFATEEPAVRQLNQIPRQNTAERFAQNSQSFGKKQRMGGKTLWLILIVILIIVIYAAYSMKWFSTDSVSSQQNTEAVSEKNEQSQSVSSEIETQTVVMSESEKTTESTETPVMPDEKQGMQQDEEKASVSSDAKIELPEQAAKQHAQSELVVEKGAVAPQNLLIVRFNAPSKFQILNADASLLREFDGRPGDVQKIEITEPVTLVVQKAASVEAEFRDQPLVLKTARRSPEARVDLK